ncbi:MAG: hypothetical protein KA257_00095 [Opitutaceae bacterium]|nr:hypothetical protein [Opitutaceae bacterium]
MHMRIAVVHPYDYYDSIPTLVALGMAVSQAGWRPALFYYGKLSVLESSPWATIHGMKRVSGRGIRARLTETRQWRQALKEQLSVEKFVIIICVDPMGLVIGAPVAKDFSIPLFYFSLEMLFWRELRAASIWALKAMETFQGRRAKWTIIQDEQRANALRRSWGMRELNFIQLPNAWPGPVRKTRSTKLRESLALPARMKIAVHAGTISEWTMVAELADAVRFWPDDWIMVVQSRFPIGEGAYEQRLRQCTSTERVRLLPVALSAPDLLELLSGADVGLVFYATREGHVTFGRNLVLAGKSSGKFSSYLQAGLPVICNQIGGVAHYVDKWRCGRVVKTTAEVGSALNEIGRDYSGYADAARRCFHGEFASEKYLPKIIQTIQKEISA